MAIYAVSNFLVQLSRSTIALKLCRLSLVLVVLGYLTKADKGRRSKGGEGEQILVLVIILRYLY
jgi:hypothetical protein